MLSPPLVWLAADLAAFSLYRSSFCCSNFIVEGGGGQGWRRGLGFPEQKLGDSFPTFCLQIELKLLIEFPPNRMSFNWRKRAPRLLSKQQKTQKQGHERYEHSHFKDNFAIWYFKALVQFHGHYDIVRVPDGTKNIQNVLRGELSEKGFIISQ